MKTHLSTLSAFLVAAAVLLLGATSAQAQAIGSSFGNLAWGDPPEAVVERHRELMMDEYQLAIAGIRDPLEMDRMRREMEQSVREIAGSLQVFDSHRTGYEISVLQDELRGNAGMSMITVRGTPSNTYFIFVDNKLFSIITAVDQVTIDYLPFEAFAEQFTSTLGEPGDTVWIRDDIGVRRLMRARWSAGASRVRLENKTRLFASYLVIYSDPSRDNAPLRAGADNPGGGVNRPTGARDLGALMDGLRESGTSSSDNSQIVDDLIGGRIEVELELRTDEEIYGIPSEGGLVGSALDEDDDLEDVEQQARPAPSRPRPQPTAAEPEDDGGGRIY